MSESPKVMKEHTLLSTTDGMVWAEEFCRIFNGKVIGSDVDEGAMVTWFANAIETGRSASHSRPVHVGTWHAFLHFYHLDHSNAAFHTAGVRYSPITFRLAEFMVQEYPVAPHPDHAEHVMLRNDYRLDDVMKHLGAYEEDKGR